MACGWGEALLQALGAAPALHPLPTAGPYPQQLCCTEACRVPSYGCYCAAPQGTAGAPLEYKAFQHTNAFHWCHQGHSLLRSFVSSLGCAIPPGVLFALISKQF